MVGVIFRRLIDGLRGFSRETVIEVAFNIESQEFRRRQNNEIGHVENPRASETDDLECLYGMCHSWLGPCFTLKEFKQKWPKIVSYVCCLTEKPLPSCLTDSSNYLLLPVKQNKANHLIEMVKGP